MLLPEIDKEKTKKNVDNLLSNYHRLKRLAGRPIDQNLTATYSFEPKADFFDPSSKIERGVIRKVNAGEIVDEIQSALNLLSVDSRKRLHQKYFQPYKQFDYEIYSNENISSSSYYRMLSKAQLEFAEAYQAGELIEFQEGTN